MKLWLLRPHYNKWPGDWYDKCFGVVVRAETEETARKLAAKEHGDETPGAWLDPRQTYCKELTANGPEECILRDFASA